jgi:hypothetical protein
MRYWLTPPEIFLPLHAEFNFTCDPCPYPLPYEGYSSLHLPWGKSNWVNPPFYAADNTEGVGLTSFARKAIEEHKKGNQSVLILPSMDYANYLMEAGAEVRSMGRVAWVSAVTGERCSPASTALFILRGNETPVKARKETSYVHAKVVGVGTFPKALAIEVQGLVGGDHNESAILTMSHDEARKLAETILEQLGQ